MGIKRRALISATSSGEVESFPARTSSAYISYTDQARGKTSYLANSRDISSLAPSWWAPSSAADGSVVLQQAGVTVEDQSLIDTANAQGAQTLAVVANYYGSGTWTWTAVNTILNNSGLRATHVAAIVSLCQTKGYDGVDIDYEHGTDANDRVPFTTFIQELVTACHAVGLIVSVVLQPKLSEPGSQARHQIQDWKAIGLVADQVRIMLYDYDPDAGATSQSPISWWQDTCAYAVTQIPYSKLELGAPTYGYEWRANGPNGGLTSTDSMMFTEIEALADTYTETKTYETTEESAKMTYTTGGTLHTWWYENAQSSSAKADLVHKYNLRGMFFWRLGGEDPAMWDALRAEMDDTGSFTIYINPTYDTYIDAGDTDKDSSTNVSLFVKSTLERRALCRFDMTLIPAGATITAATFSLYKNGFAGTDPVGRTYEVRRLLQTAWAEGNDGNPATTGTTWDKYDVASNLSWNTAGASGSGTDYTPTDAVQAVVPATNNFMDFSILNLANWAKSNGGILNLIVKDTVNATNHQAQFASRQIGTPTQRPRLTLTYTV